MKKNDIQNLRKKSEKDLVKDISTLKVEIAKEALEDQLQDRKDTNIIAKKRKTLAILKTIVREKQISI